MPGGVSRYFAFVRHCRAALVAPDPECAHVLYATPKCSHEFISGQCVICGWDGSSSPYIQSLLWPPQSSA
ncbi:hypothetical protein EBA01_01360 [Xanthomonas oryzae pv. oryzae]|nr:hypothetical protein BVV16_01390 [Xanthomonas oryzae pv. oryzae]QBG98119.1 hypothetical protein EYC55_21485 [Xanthomonas oryzae]AUI95951.1 hypothetical protein BVV17_01390 [Xanthomonas oryzae pv. oryzae]AUI99624.1 hypothetical protein BVV18_01395 [Xanthomonas oryzae pv. oryzae]AUJ03302.1 hypothetical protein BVV10_01390 [Xanthomonas oryzae pv. oryzae]